MGAQGVPCQYTSSEIREAIERHKGRLCVAAKALKIKYDTIRKYVDREPALRELVDELRKDYVETMLDSAEDCLSDAMDNRKADMSNALRASMFFLNNQGKARNYNPPAINQQGDIKITPSQLKEVKEMLMKEDPKVESPQQD